MDEKLTFFESLAQPDEDADDDLLEKNKIPNFMKTMDEKGIIRRANDEKVLEPSLSLVDKISLKWKSILQKQK